MEGGERGSRLDFFNHEKSRSNYSTLAQHRIRNATMSTSKVELHLYCPWHRLPISSELCFVTLYPSTHSSSTQRKETRSILSVVARIHC